MSFSLSVARAHPRISSSVGVCRPFSSLDTLDGGHNKDSASCLPLISADRRSSRSRLPSASRASCTLVTLVVLFSGKVVPSYGVVPGGIAPIIVRYDHGGVFDDFTAAPNTIFSPPPPHVSSITSIAWCSRAAASSGLSRRMAASVRLPSAMACDFERSRNARAVSSRIGCARLASLRNR